MSESTSSETHAHEHRGPGYLTPQAAIEESEPETTLYVPCLYVGTGVDAPDLLAVVDADPESPSHSEIDDRGERNITTPSVGYCVPY